MSVVLIGGPVNRRNNARYRANEMRMEAAALELMRARDKVNVRTVCERAGVNRSTFYAHFRDVPDMLAKMEATLHGELMESYGSLGVDPLSEESFVPLLEHVREHAYFYGVALERRVDFPSRRGYEGLMKAVVRPLAASGRESTTLRRWRACSSSSRRVYDGTEAVGVPAGGDDAFR